MASENVMQANKSNPLLHGLSGSIGGVVSCAIFQPLDVIKTRQQQQSGSRRGMYSIARSVLQQDGVLALWRGTMPTIYRTLPGSTVYFALLNVMQNTLSVFIPKNNDDGTAHRLRQTIVNIQNMFAGATARALAGVMLNPITVVKARYESNLYQYHNTWNALVVIFQQEGWRGLFSGVWATVYRDAPYAGIYVLTYERLKLAGKTLPILADVPHTAIHFGSGVLAGFAATLTTQPFDVIKTRAQVLPTKYPTFSRTVVRIFQEQGFSGFFSGMMPRLVRKSLMTASTWTIYEEIKRLVIQQTSHAS